MREIIILGKERLASWWNLRPVQFFWQGLPAVILLVGLAAASIYYTGWNSLVVHDRFDGARKSAMAQGNLPEARIALERLIRVSTLDPSLRPRLPEHLFNMAMCLKDMGSLRDADDLLDRVAPLGEDISLNYPKAQLYLAKTVWQEAKVRDEALLSQIERHLLRAAVDEPGMEEAFQLLGELYLHRREWAKAKRCFLKAVDKRGECLLLMALLSQQTGDQDATRQWSIRANAFFQTRLDSNNQENPVARIGLAKSHLLLGEYGSASAVYVTGFQRTGNADYKAAAAGVYSAWIMGLRQKSSNVPLETILEKIRTGLGYDPKSEYLLQELILISESTGDAAKQAAETIRQMLAEGGDTSLLHFCLGIQALRRTEQEQAKQHFDLAFAAAPNLPQIANNMAMMMSEGDGADLEKAFTIIDPVAQRFPGLAPVLDTRGQILTKMKRWKEGIVDLELALKGMPGAVPTHRALALCYENLNLLDLAAEHYKRANPAGSTPAP